MDADTRDECATGPPGWRGRSAWRLSCFREDEVGDGEPEVDAEMVQREYTGNMNMESEYKSGMQRARIEQREEGRGARSQKRPGGVFVAED